jgi:2-ketocyclohexanecarboxyl-CoA hydrolase
VSPLHRRRSASDGAGERRRARRRLDAEVARWCEELTQRSPTAIAIAKKSFNADTEHQRGIGALGMQSVALYYNTDESKEGGNAQREKRAPRFFDSTE